MIPGLGDLAGLFKQARQMQEKMARMQEELARRSFSVDSGGGLVTATVNGRGELTDIRIDPRAVSDVEVLEDLIRAAVTSAMQRSQEAVKEEMAKLTGGLNLPGLTDLLGGSPTRP